jgi:hypothetical protein
VVGTDTYRDRRYYDDRYYYPARGPGRHRHGKYRGYDWDD